MSEMMSAEKVVNEPTVPVPSPTLSQLGVCARRQTVATRTPRTKGPESGPNFVTSPPQDAGEGGRHYGRCWLFLERWSYILRRAWTPGQHDRGESRRSPDRSPSSGPPLKPLVLPSQSSGSPSQNAGDSPRERMFRRIALIRWRISCVFGVERSQRRGRPGWSTA